MAKQTQTYEYYGRDYRTAKELVVTTDRLGRRVTMRLCEELVEGRWEPFFSIVKTEEKASA